MELCTARTISNLPHHTLFTANHSYLRSKTSLPLKLSIPRTTSGLLYYTNSSLRATTSEEMSTGPSHGGEEPGVITVEGVQQVEKNSYAEIVRNKEPNEDSSMDGQAQAFEFLDNLDIKLDYEDAYPILLFGGGSLIALWLATVVVGAIDSIPLFPKLMELAGLAYTLWFSTCYLIFKKNRDELFAKIEEIKQLVLGSNGG